MKSFLGCPSALDGELSPSEAAFQGLRRSRGPLPPSGMLLIIAFSTIAMIPSVSLLKLAPG